MLWMRQGKHRITKCMQMLMPVWSKQENNWPVPPGDPPSRVLHIYPPLVIPLISTSYYEQLASAAR